MPKLLPKEQADILCEKWLNGSRREVLRALTTMSSMRASCVAAYMIMELDEFPRDEFIATMEERLA